MVSPSPQPDPADLSPAAAAILPTLARLAARQLAYVLGTLPQSTRLSDDLGLDDPDNDLLLMDINGHWALDLPRLPEEAATLGALAEHIARALPASRLAEPHLCGHALCIMVQRDDRYWIVGPFPDMDAACAWGRDEANNPGDDPRWQTLYLAHPGKAPEVFSAADPGAVDGGEA